jgi:flagellar basal-body rod protein FlgC
MTLQQSFDLAAGALEVFSNEMKIHAQNVANINTPYYVRKIPVISENNQLSFDDVLAHFQQKSITNGTPVVMKAWKWTG